MSFQIVDIKILLKESEENSKILSDLEINETTFVLSHFKSCLDGWIHKNELIMEAEKIINEKTQDMESSADTNPIVEYTHHQHTLGETWVIWRTAKM